jgi:hypothetical protein
MRIATAQKLSSGLRELAQNVSRRLWIASPFVGGWSATKCLLDTRWQHESVVGVRLLTDIENKGWLDPATIRAIAGRGDVKHIHGLHAKIFIVDDCALVTSANLTRTAFERRTEIGVFLSGAESAQVIGIFERWWNDAEDPPNGWIEKLAVPTQRGVRNGRGDEPGGARLRKLHSLPPEPSEIGGKDAAPKIGSLVPRDVARPASPTAAEFHSLFKQAKHFFLCNTNRRHDRDAEPQMRERGYAAAWEKFSSTRRMNEVESGDAVLFYANGYGIIGVGRAKSPLEILKPGAPDRLSKSGNEPEWRIPLDWLVWADKDEDAFHSLKRTLTFEKVNGEKYRDLRNRVRRHFESLAGLQLTR